MVTRDPKHTKVPRQGRTKETFWRKVLVRFEQSRLSQKDFCKREQLNPSNLSWWKREIAARDANSNATVVVQQRKNYDESVHAYWRKVIAQFNISGLSRYDFCTREGIKPESFSWWRGELERLSSKQSAAAAAPQIAQMFVPVKVRGTEPITAQPIAKLPRVIAEIDIVRGTVNVLETATAESLVSLFKALKELVHD